MSMGDKIFALENSELIGTEIVMQAKDADSDLQHITQTSHRLVCRPVQLMPMAEVRERERTELRRAQEAAKKKAVRGRRRRVATGSDAQN